MFRQTILKIFIDDYLKKGGKSPFGVVKKDVVWTRIFYVYTIKKNNENMMKKCAKLRKKALQMYFQCDKIEKLRKTGDEAEGC